ncbi:MAG: M6 family metalloprotease domain-containing protein [Bacteroidaceae bacterium]|nr:M6 family metalloprotease domain-containing protein [Bacteroidaceae bacterium]
MKKTLLLLSMLLASLCLLAQPALDDPRFPLFDVKQSDGTTLQVRAFSSARTDIIFYGTIDNVALVRNEKGDYCYAMALNDSSDLAASDIIAHEASMRSADEQSLARETPSVAQAFKILKGRINASVVKRSRISANRIRTKWRNGLGTYGQTGPGAVNSIGKYTIPVVLVEFADRKFQASSTNERYNRWLNEEGYSDNGSVGSVRDYFISQSKGLFEPNFEIVARVTLPQNAGYYGGDRGTAKDTLLWTFIQDAVNAARSQGVNFNKYATTKTENGVPLVALLYAGTGQATSGQTDDLWPCELDLGSYYASIFGGTSINSVFIGNELVRGNFSGIGTFVHEFGHALGLPDIYCTDYSHSRPLTGYWSVMESGCYLGNGYRPIGYMAHEKNYLGWLKIPEPTETHVYTLYPMISTKEPHAMLLRNDSNASEYFIIEHRMPDTWYPEDMGAGALITHVDYDDYAWSRNLVNREPDHLRYTVVSSSNTLSSSSTDLYPAGTAMFTDRSTPSSKVFKGTNLRKPIYSISYKRTDPDKIITFAYGSISASAYWVGDTVETKDLTARIEKDKQLTVLPKANGLYSGEVNIPDSVFRFDNSKYCFVAIDSNAFRNCTELTAITIGDRVATIGNGAFRGATALQRVEASPKSPYFMSIDGTLFSLPDSEATLGEDSITSIIFSENKGNLPTSTSTQRPEEGHVTGFYPTIGATLELIDGTTPTFLWASTSSSTIRLRTAAEAKLIIKAPHTFSIDSIQFSGSTVSLTADEGTLNGKVWTGEAAKVEFTTTATCNITEIFIHMKRTELPTLTLVQTPLTAEGTLVVPDGVGRIAPYAMEQSRYSKAELPTSIVSVGVNALSASGLESLQSMALTPPACDEGNPFTLVDQTQCELVVDKQAAEAYAAAPYWKDFVNVRTVTGINNPQLRSKSAIYDLQGRRVNQLSKGIYIIGNKKIIR